MERKSWVHLDFVGFNVCLLLGYSYIQSVGSEVVLEAYCWLRCFE